VTKAGSSHSAGLPESTLEASAGVHPPPATAPAGHHAASKNGMLEAGTAAPLVAD